MKPTISFYTLGCRLNQSETAVIARTFAEDGYPICDIKTPADVAVINTCTVTENGDADTRRLVHKVRRLNPKVRIALVGCQAQVQKSRLAELPNVRWVVGNESKINFLDIFKKSGLGADAQIIVPTIIRRSFTLPTPAIDPGHTRANLKIQDGCDFFCSFCEIPYARGRARSRLFADIVKEAKILAAHGYKEVVLTGINIGTYKQSRKSFLDVIDALEQIEGIARIRISSIEPTTIPAKLIEKIKRSGKLCRHLHIPVQSASDKILRLMKRKYTFREYLELIQNVTEEIKEVCIGTDVIAGFPAEGIAEFEDTYMKLREAPIHYFHVFSYSNRTMAKSRKDDSMVSIHDIRERSERLRALGERKRRVFAQNLLNTTQRVLFEGKKDNTCSGLTDHYVRVYVESARDLSNTLADVRIKNYMDNKLIAQVN